MYSPGENFVRITLEGERKSGKSNFICSVIDFYKSMGFSPAQFYMPILDWDFGGITPIINRKVPKEFFQSIDYFLIENNRQFYRIWKEKIKPKLDEHIGKFGKNSAMLVIENAGNWWDVIQSNFAEEAYGRSLYDVTIKAVKKNIEKQEGKSDKGAAVFDRMRDYGAMNSGHNIIRNEMLSGKYNVIMTAHLKDKYENNKVIGQTADGHKTNDSFTDFILRFFKDDRDDKFTFSLIGSRFLKTGFRNIPDPSFTHFWKLIRKGMEIEKNPEWANIGKLWMEMKPPTKNMKIEEKKGDDGAWQ